MEKKTCLSIFVFLFSLTIAFGQWQTSGSDIYYNAGRVGIGTSAPGFPLEVQVPNNTNGIILGNAQGARFFQKVNEIGGGQLFVRDEGGNDVIFLNSTGQSFFLHRIGIGFNPVNNPNNYMLAVNGLIGTKEVQVENSSATWPDYVFSDEYDLLALSELESFIQKNRHLPDIPSAAEVKENNGVKLGELNVQLLKKVEELTLYMIEQSKKTEELMEKVQLLEKENQQLKERINSIEK